MLDITFLLQTELYLLDLDKSKLRQFIRLYDFANIAKRKRNEHERVCKYLLLVIQIKKGIQLMHQRAGCEIDKDNTTPNRKGEENLCVHWEDGRKCRKGPKTDHSMWCKFFEIDLDKIDIYQVSNYIFYSTKILFFIILTAFSHNSYAN